MTDHDQIVALAELDGLEHKQTIVDGEIMPGWDWWQKKGTDIRTDYASLPNYLTDLNAVHELEKKIQNDRSRFSSVKCLPRDYICYLMAICLVRKVWENGECLVSAIDAVDKCYHATARQRCEAILRATGKWKDE